MVEAPSNASDSGQMSMYNTVVRQHAFSSLGNPSSNVGQFNQQHGIQEVQQIELLCKQMYESTDLKERSNAEARMLEFGSSPNSMSKCRLILENSNLCYAQLLAAQTLIKIITKHASNFTAEQKLEIRNFIINYLANKEDLERFVVQAITKLYAKLTKIAWFESKDAQQVLPQINQLFLSVNQNRQILGVLLLTQLVEEINLPEGDQGHRSNIRQRRVSSSFRDNYLLDIFSLSCNLLQTCYSMRMNDSSNMSAIELSQSALKLALNCLQYDFIGTSTEDSNLDDMPTVQVPASWKRLFIESSTTDLFFSLYHAFPPNIASQALACLVQLTSVRRSLFTTAERLQFLNRIVSGLKGLLENPSGLADSSSYHEFCRLLLRFKANFQLSEIVKVQQYAELMALIKNFTINSFQEWNCGSNSVHYLLMLWQKLVSSATYCEGMGNHNLDAYAPEIVKVYTTFRLKGVTEVVQDGADDPLDDFAMLNQQMEQISYISRHQFTDTATFLREAFDSTFKHYQELSNQQPHSQTSTEIQIYEGRLTWLTYIMTATIAGRLFLKSDHESMEGDLALRIFQLISFSDSQLAQNKKCEKLEIAFLHFYEIYRRCYITDQTQHGNKMHKRMTEAMGLNDESRLLSLFVTKIVTNLNYWSTSEFIVKDTLTLLHELSMGFSSLTRISDLPEIKFMLQHHTPEHFPFLGSSCSIQFMKYRTSFYCSTARLLLENMRNSDEELFDIFMLPLDEAFNQMREVIVVNPSPALAHNVDAKKAFIGLCRDVRGIAREFVKPPSNVLLFEWIYPQYTQVIKNALELWSNDPDVTTPALKLITELVDSRERRSYYEGASPEVVYLFREISSILVSFGERLISITDFPSDKIYQYKLKNIAIAFKMLHISLRGKINLAIFQLYGDTIINDLLQMFIKMFLSVVQCDILSYPKLTSQYYPLMEVLSSNHFNFLINLAPGVFATILDSLVAGLTVSEEKTNTSCFVSINNILSQLFKWLTKPARKIRTNNINGRDEDLREASRRVLQTHATSFYSMLEIMLGILISTESTKHPLLHGPFLCLILLYEDTFNQLRQNLISTYPADKQTIVSGWFDSLMEGTSRNLSQQNKDKFISNVINFKRQFDPRSLVDS